MDKTEYNLLELVPKRLFECARTEEGLAQVLVPRFKSEFFRRFLVPRSRDPFVRVKLDKFGTLIWDMCDGSKSIAEIAGALTEKFGDEVQPVEDRLALFIRQMRQYQYISLCTKDGANL
jgi:hypothetical protein